MSYTVFALKWRPKVFDEIVGQSHIVNTLTNAITKNRLAHAYLFAGPRGVGKTSTARILARALNCEQGPTATPCGTCFACQYIAKGSSLDVIEIDGASNRGIDEIRALRENVKFAPAQGRYKVYIIDEVHQITSDGFNALLKTLEEPPEFVKFIFATTNPNKVPPTILSRCQRLDFRRISILEIINQLERICKAEGLQVEREVLVAIARSSDGALRDAESILDQLVAFAKDKISLDDVIAMLGLVEQSALFELTEKIIHRDPKGALELLNQVIAEGKDLGILLNNLVEHFRNLMIAKVAQADSQLIDLPQEICEKLSQQAGALRMEEIFNAFAVLQNAQDMSRRLDSLRIPVEIALVRLSQDKAKEAAGPHHPPAAGHHPAAGAPASAPKSAPASAPRSAATSLPRPASTSAPKPASAPAPSGKPALIKDAPPVRRPDSRALLQEEFVETAAETVAGSLQEISLDKIKENWQGIIDHLSKIKISLASYLTEGIPREIKGNLLTVVFPKNLSLHKEALEDKHNRVIVEQNMSEVINNNVRLRFTLSDEEKLDEVGKDHPVLRSALEMFNARLIKEE
ncbi:MAG TPA: DNA polymerase III subunit gamma/tau [Candidatus Omnitrophota bacterium]|nr:DNA polymerase III subunit gamma/tau [Candidatus Omnitrophota bacterium]HRZ15528.1 DNA polymerase III subunit gamma/tau [Candidatus Omnitrophota bacterium]